MRKLMACAAVVVVLGGLIAGRAGAYPSGGALPPVLTLEVPIAGLDGVPLDAAGVAMNVTVTGPLGAGYVTVYPCGDLPPTSNVNYITDQTVPNFVVSALSPDGTVCIDTTAVVDVIVDLAGYLPAGSPVVTLPTPARVADSRTGVGIARRLDAGVEVAVPVGGVDGVPSDASMALFNATVADPASAGFLTVYPCGQARPDTSTLNYTAHANVPNFAFAKLGAGGQVCLYSQAATDVILDVGGYVPAAAGDVVALPAPERLLDTRVGIGGPAGKVTAAGRVLQLGGVGDVPPSASAVIVNLTATQATASGYVTAYPCDSTAPIVSNLNVTPGVDVADLAIVKLDASGRLCFTSNTSVDVIADVTGYLDGETSIVALPPQRIYDSRDGVDPWCNIGARGTAAGVSLFDLRTGIEIHQIAVFAAPPPVVMVRSDCQRIYIVSKLSPTSGYNIWELDATGSTLDTRLLPAGVSGGDLMITDFNVLSVEPQQSGETWVRDAMTGEVMLTLPELTEQSDGGLRWWRAVGATADGSLIALQYPTEDGRAKVITYLTPDGTVLGQWQTPIAAFNFHLSPLGTYLSYDISTGSVTVDGYVVTLDGSGVASTQNLRSTGPWLSDGALMTCAANGAGVFAGRWDLFSPVKPLIPAQPSSFCLLGAG